ncbi:MAG: class I SAM-dependent methyltransferase [Cocleimonas sp.]
MNSPKPLNSHANWYQTLSGQSSLNSLDSLCAETLSEIFGYYAIEIGMLSGQHGLLKHSRITAGFSLVDDVSKVKSSTPFGQKGEHQSSVISSIEQLPIATDNIDLVIASHTLESSQDPHQVLREIDRVLVPEGHCILIGFNPFSLSQLGKTIRSRFINRSTNRGANKNKPHDESIYQTRSVARVRDWFSVLGFEVVDVQYMGMRPAVKNKKLFDALSWLERLGEYAGPMLGNMYVIHAKKQMAAIRPDKKVWRAPAVLSGGKVVLNSTAQKIRRENFSNS